MRTETQARETVLRLEQEILADLGGELLSPDTMFLGNMTLGEYFALSDEEKDVLWETWGDIDLMELNERKVGPDVLLAQLR
ncbi:MAG: hypothetical protein WHX52_17005 [Anaerolineae bacterium]